MKKYSFCKDDGKIKQSYIQVCEYLLESKKERREVTRGRYEEVVDEYDCYSTPTRDFYAKEKRNYISKIQEICSNFKIETREWFGLRSLSVDLIGDNVDKMLSEINIMLKE